MPRGIIVFGKNGCGKSTIGKELARRLHYKYMDIEDYHFVESEIPYTIERTQEECINLMIEDIKKYENFVISAVTGDFGDEIISMYELGVFITAPFEIRINRIKERSIKKFGSRVVEGGDMYESNNKFIDFVKGRDYKKLEEWSNSLECPIIYIDGTKDIKENIDLIIEKYLKIN